MIDWVDIDGKTIGPGAVTAGALQAEGTAIGTITSVVPGNGQNTIHFTETGADSYNIYWKTSAGVTKLNGTKITGVTTPHVHSGRTNGVEIFYVYTAVLGGIESVESNEVSGTPNTNPPLPTLVFFAVRA